MRTDPNPHGIVTPVKIMNVANERSAVVRAAWDTGATFSTLTRRVIDELCLDPISPCITEGVNGLMAGTTRIALTFPGNTRFVTWAEMSEAQQLPGGLDALIGLDIICRGDLHLAHEDDGLWFEFVFRPEFFIDFESDDTLTVMRKLAAGLQQFRNRK